MDVTCERCNTEYEFDDALVSDRGTTVKCTNCGYQFKVKKPEPSGTPEKWVVRTVDGRELEFRALRELQFAIAQAVITRDDVLSRGATRPRRLGSIAELEPFFATAGVAAGAQLRTAHGLGPTRPRVPTPIGLGYVQAPIQRHDASIAIPLPQAPSQQVVAAPPSLPPESDDETKVMPPALSPRRAPTIPGVAPPSEGYGPASVEPPTNRIGDVSQSVSLKSLKSTMPIVAEPTPQRDATPMPPPSTALADTEPAAAGLPEVVEAPQPVANGAADHAPSDPDARSSDGSSSPSAPLLTPTPSAVRASYGHEDSFYNDPRFSSASSSKRGGAPKWIVGFVLVGMLALAGATVGRKLLTPSSKPSGVSDEKVATLLADGERALLDGDLDQAKEQLTKASVLDEKEPRLLTDEARLEVLRAELDWLKARLLATDDPDRSLATRELEHSADRAKKASEAAFAASPNDPPVLRARIDALRIAGDLAGARKLVVAISSNGSQPDNALTLAALDLAEASPSWPAVIDRLRAAAAGEQNLGRARSLLVFALAQSGDLAGAKVELDKLAALARPHPLVRQLRAFLGRGGGKAVDVASLPEVGAATDAPADPREAVRLGNAARGKGDLKRAQQLYAAALAKAPGDPEALTGMAEIARAKNDATSAQKAYEQALAKSPGFLPALAGYADMKWDAGDKTGALDLYKQVLDKGGASSAYAKRAQDRITGKSSSSPGRPSAPIDVPPTSPAGPTPVAGGDVDTSDLPGVKAAPPDKPAPPPDKPAPPPDKPAPPPGVDTSDLPGFH